MQRSPVGCRLVVGLFVTTAAGIGTRLGIGALRALPLEFLGGGRPDRHQFEIEAQRHTRQRMIAVEHNRLIGEVGHGVDPGRGLFATMAHDVAHGILPGANRIALVADDFVWVLFWLLQAATLLRLGAAVWPAHASVLSAAAALAWTGVWAAWAARYLPVLLRPRSDGRPG